MKPHVAALRRFTSFLLVPVFCFSLSACRESPVLHETLYEQAAPEVDEEQEMLDPEDEGEEDEQFDNQQDDSAETERDNEADMGLNDPSQSDAGSSMDVEYAPSYNHDWQSQDAPSDSAQGQDGSQNAGASSESPESEAVPDAVPGGESQGKQIVDASGRTVTIPQNVETVTAVHWAAQMVEMLGGSGRLLGADSDFLSSSLAKAAFSDLATVSQLWSGSGGNGMTDDQFASLLALHPDVCFEISGEYTFTSAQIDRLTGAGIAYVTLPALTGTDTLKQAVSLIAEVLGSNHSTGESASSIAAAYSGWVDDVLNDTKGGIDCTSLYISGWDSSASYVLSHTKGVIESQGSGLAMAYSPKKAQLASAFMKAAGVVNESTRIMSIHRDSEYVYVSPMFHQFDPVVSGRSAAFYSGAGEYGSAFDLFVARMVSDTVYYQLGSSQFPAVIAADKETKAQLETNWFWNYHEADTNGYVTISGESFYCGVIGEYDIYVNPQGMCDWAQGSAESPLEAYWIASKFGNDLTLDDVKQKTNDFYQQFFCLTLSEDQLDGIFAE